MKKIVRVIDTIEIGCGCSLLSLIIIIMTLQIFCRYILNKPLKWPEELSVLLACYLTFLGASLVFRRKGHMAFTYLYEKFPSSLQKWVDIVLNIITIIVLSIIVYESIILQKMQSNFLYFAAMPITKNYFTLPVTIGGISIVISALLFVYDDIKEVFKK